MNVKFLILLIISSLVLGWIFMYEYVPSGNGVIYKINRYTKDAHVFYPGEEEWEKIKPYKSVSYDDLLAEIPVKSLSLQDECAACQ